jgi:hypothetical protein
MDEEGTAMRVSSLLVWGVFAAASSAFAQQTKPYSPPRTAAGHPDLTGAWIDGFLTTLERPPAVDQLVAPPAAAERVAQMISSRFPDVIDPDIAIQGTSELALVKGEFRTSIIVDPADGQLPYSAAGEALAQATIERRARFDDPEDRPLPERCLGGFGVAPMRGFVLGIPRQIVQTADNVVIFTQDTGGARIIRLGEELPPQAVRSIAGSSTGRWEGDTLLIETANFSAIHPARFGLGRPLLISTETRVEERLTRVSDTELHVRFTVRDDDLYTQPWSGEFSFHRLEAPVFEYGCQGRNYALPSILRGG